MKRILAVVLCAVILCTLVPICAVSEAATPKLVAITFDDGPSVYTPTLLDGLKSRGAKATFFVVGNRLSSFSGTVERIVKEGHQLANHTTTHPDLSGLSLAGVQNELNTCESRLRNYGGNQTYAIRPPYGSYNYNVKTSANGPLILWSVDTLDWKNRNADAVYNQIINNTKDGSVVLLHDLYSTSVQGALRAIDTLQARGYECVTVNELFRRRGITMQNGSVYTCAYNKGITLPAVETPAVPVITVKNVMGGKQVSMKCATENTTLYYTTDGTTPTKSSKKYTGTLTLTQTTDFKVAAYNGIWSEELSQRVTVTLAPAPKINYEDHILTLTSNGKMYYTIDASVPTVNSAVYKSPVSITKQCDVLVRVSGYADRYVTYTLTRYGDLFTDVSAKAWYYKSVGKAVHCGIMKGMGNYEFAPESDVTRGMFVTALFRMSPDANGKFSLGTFTDVKKGSWYANAVAWGEKTGIVCGMGDGRFSPDAKLSREQMCVLLNRYLEYYNIELPKEKREAFSDADQISSWAKKGVNSLYETGLVNGMGDGSFCPAGTATRAQCATVLVALQNQTK